MEVRLVDDGSTEDIVTIRIVGPGLDLMIMGEIEEIGGILVARRVHIGATPGGANSLGLRRFREIAGLLMDLGGYDAILVEGHTRTTGANPGRRPRPLRFSR
jgi:hypothetical protein